MRGRDRSRDLRRAARLLRLPQVGRKVRLRASTLSPLSITDHGARLHSPESVACARCARVFHLSCVDPPLAAKPKAGYGWSCAPCSKAHDEEVEGYLEAGMGPPPVRKAAGDGVRAVAQGGSPGPQMLHASKKGKARQGQSAFSLWLSGCLSARG